MVRIRRSSFRGSSSVQSFEEDEINIYLKVINTVALKVKRTETIRNLKALLCKEKGISENFQELFFSGERLNDNNKLIDCGIRNNSTIHLILQTSGVMKLFITIISTLKTIEIEATSQDTIERIKSKVQANEEILSHQFSLFYGGRLLENYKTLASLGIEGESTLHLVFDPLDILSVYVKMPTGETVKVEVKVLYTIGEMKAIIESMVGVSTATWCLAHEGVRLEDSKTLAWYGLKEDYVLEVPLPKIRIFVKAWSGETIALYVKERETVLDVKNKVFHMLQSQPNEYHYLVFGCKRLEDGRDLASYGIGNQSTLNMVHLPDTQFPFVRFCSIGDVLPGIDMSTTVYQLKQLIREKTETPVKEVLFEENVLEDQFSLLEYGIDEDTVLEYAVDDDTVMGFAF